MSEQAQDALASLDDLASMLDDQPEEESTEELEATDADESRLEEEDTDEDANAEQDESEEEEPAPERKVKITVKGDDGQESETEVSEDELVRGYQRQSDYTKKTQQLAQREAQAVQFFTQKHDEIRNNYLQQAELNRAAIVGMAGLKSEQEMQQLASSDPAAWVAENQRQQSIRGYLGQLEQQIQAEKQQAAQQAQQRQEAFKQQAYAQAWEQLSRDGIDKPKLTKIFQDANSNYGFTAEELSNVYDARLVRALKDAAAYRELQAQKKQVSQKVAAAPKLPNRQANPQAMKRDQALETRFRRGTAKLSDLAAYLR